MKIQFDADSLRIRLDEADFCRLRGSAMLSTALTLAGAPVWIVSVLSGAAASVRRAGPEMIVTVPAAELDALAARLPARDGLAFEWPRDGARALRVLLDVDVRDSVRTRHRR